MIDDFGTNQIPINSRSRGRAFVGVSHFRLRERIFYGTVGLLVLEQ